MLFGTLYIWTLMCGPVFCQINRDIWDNIPCDKVYIPENCNDSKYLQTVDDYERCAPAKLDVNSRDYYLAADGRRLTYMDNKHAYDRLRLLPRMLRDVSNSSISTTVLGKKMDIPVGLSPTGLHKLAHPNGELEVLKGVSQIRTVMILSSYSTIAIEDVGRAAQGQPITLWMQVYMWTNRSLTISHIQRAENSGFQGIVVTADSNILTTLSCNERINLDFKPGVSPVNIDYKKVVPDPSFTFKDITWLTTITQLPIIAKGLLSPKDAKEAALAGASAILVSNHGGRQLDGDPATIDILPSIVEAMSHIHPRRDIYLDGGVRSGSDVYKAIARGASMVFIGRPYLWGLTMEGAVGVEKIVNILTSEFEQTMNLCGAKSIPEIDPETVIERSTSCHFRNH